MGETTIILEELGRGGGGKVHKALHVPSMRLVAVKIMEVHDDEKRHQLIRELKTLNSMVRVSRCGVLFGANRRGGWSAAVNREGNCTLLLAYIQETHIWCVDESRNRYRRVGARFG